VSYCHFCEIPAETDKSNLLQLDKKLSKSMEFRELTQRDAEISLEHYLEKLKATFQLPEDVSERQDRGQSYEHSSQS
jgi:hypothetical protein